MFGDNSYESLDSMLNCVLTYVCCAVMNPLGPLQGDIILTQLAQLA